jgi:uncharacterized protein YodC (DUF2158 family)
VKPVLWGEMVELRPGGPRVVAEEAMPLYLDVVSCVCGAQRVMGWDGKREMIESRWYTSTSSEHPRHRFLPLFCRFAAA